MSRDNTEVILDLVRTMERDLASVRSHIEHDEWPVAPLLMASVQGTAKWVAESITAEAVKRLTAERYAS